MINKIFKTRYPFLSEYFELCLKNKKRFPQSLVFEGLDTLSQYFFTLELARLVNCENKTENCDCPSCRWARENKHPAIINVSPLDFKDDDTKSSISIGQIRKLSSQIRESVDFHRFYVFSNAKEGALDSRATRKIAEFENAGFKFNRENYVLGPLNTDVMQDACANALLKSTEEAPDKVTFVFLSKTRSDLISTIVSRSLVFQLPKMPEKADFDPSLFFENYPDLKIEHALDLIQTFFEITEGTDIITVLDSMQEYLIDFMKKNLHLYDSVTRDIKEIQTAKTRILASVQPKYAIEGLFVGMSKEAKGIL